MNIPSSRKLAARPMALTWALGESYYYRYHAQSSDPTWVLKIGCKAYATDRRMTVLPLSSLMSVIGSVT